MFLLERRRPLVRSARARASHLRLGPDRYERLSAHVLPHAAHVGEHARACLLDHAAELQQAIADITGEQVLVDVAAGALERAGEARGPRRA